MYSKRSNGVEEAKNMLGAILPLIIWLALIIAIIYIIVKAVKTSTARRDRYLEQIQMQLVHLQHEVERLRELVEGKGSEDESEEE